MFTLNAGPVPIAMDYYEASGGSVAQLRWKLPGSSSFVTIPAANLSPPGTDQNLLYENRPL
jgi:hypothetical protein